MRYLFILLAVLLSSCAQTYHPVEYQLTDDRIFNFDTTGPVTVLNGQHDITAVKIFDDKVTWTSSDAEISEALSNQLQKEINKHGHTKGGEEKFLTITVMKFYTDRSTFVFHTSVDVKVDGGNGFEKMLHIEDGTNGSFGGNIVRSFNGAIAVAVIHILGDQDVLSYLGS